MSRALSLIRYWRVLSLDALVQVLTLHGRSRVFAIAASTGQPNNRGSAAGSRHTNRENFVPAMTANKSSNLIDTAGGMQTRVATR